MKRVIGLYCVCLIVTLGCVSCNDDDDEHQMECETPQDCLEQDWNVDCVGHWACENGLCKEVCDDVKCGDGVCKPEEGESKQSCPYDCNGHECVREGLPTDGSSNCCQGLIALFDCILVAEEPPSNLKFCVDCNDQVCEPHENWSNCEYACKKIGCEPDCHDENGSRIGSCNIGEKQTFKCADSTEVPWCTCEYNTCIPICKQEDDQKGLYWYDSCVNKKLENNEGNPIKCSKEEQQRVECQKIGSKSEGWYVLPVSTIDQEPKLIIWSLCYPHWKCVEDPSLECNE